MSKKTNVFTSKYVADMWQKMTAQKFFVLQGYHF